MTTSLQHQHLQKRLDSVIDVVLAAEPAVGRPEVERLLRVVGALIDVHAVHRVDDRGRCTGCHPRRRLPWQHEGACTVLKTIDRALGARG